MSWSKDFLLEFIELLRENEVLWKIKHKDYHNQIKRNGCYEILLRKMKEIDPSAVVSKVQKKINNLRTVFRKELKKVEASRASGSGTDNIYVPKLWYFENLMFLKDQEQPYGATSSSMNTQSDDESTQTSVDDMPTLDSPKSDIGSVPITSFSEPQQPLRFKRQKCMSASQNVDKTIESIGNKICEITADDKFDAFGKNVAHKLRSLPTNQRLFAEKIINDALFEAEMGNLNRQCCLKVVPAQYFSTIHSQHVQPITPQIVNFQASQPFTLQPRINPTTQQEASTQQVINFQISESSSNHPTSTSQQAEYNEQEDVQILNNDVQTFFNNFSAE